MLLKASFTWSVLFLVLAVAAGCQKTYYQVWETLGKEKRHLLRDQIEEVRDDQQNASEEFQDALSQIKAMYGYEGGDLEKMYNRLSADYDDSVLSAQRVSERIEKVQRIAKDLFDEWQAEIDQIDNPGFKTKSRQKLSATRKRYARLEKSMLAARARMTPVLDDLQDYVLFVKHNLNARAIGSLKSEVDEIEADVQTLIADIQQSIREANDFLKEFERES